jgi:serine/threonine protein kinase
MDSTDRGLSDIFARVLQAAPAARGDLIRDLCRHDQRLARDVAELVDAAARSLSTDAWRAGVLLPAAQPLPRGTVIGAYEILDVLGAGGMGIVYLARDRELDVPRAIKAVRPDVAGGARVRDRLRHEAQVAARLPTHPHIATTHAYFEQDGAAYIVQEYVDGDTLRATLQRGPLTPDQAIDASRAILSALAVAHAAGVVHRDLKPENVICTRSGAYKVLDFGIARLESPMTELTRQTLSAPGETPGTIGYMAPEQLRGDRGDARSDLFAFGVVLYEMVTGRHPFGRGTLSTVSAVLTAPPAPLLPDERARVPPAIQTIVDRCLEKDPAARPASAADVSAWLTSSEPHRTSAPAASAPSTGSDLWWWQFHLVAAALADWLLLWPLWHARAWVAPVDWRLVYFPVLAALCIGPSLRLHLWFMSRQHPEDTMAQHSRYRPRVLACDAIVAVALVATAMLVSREHAGWATLLAALGLGSLVVSLFVEPVTTKRALRSLANRA